MWKVWNCKLRFFVSGDGTCQATKDALALLKKTFGVQSTQRIYGRKLDLMFIDRKHKAELCSSEWKKRDISLETLLCQQTKNLRVSKCIFKKIVKLHISLPELQSLSIDIMDWRGKYRLLMKGVKCLSSYLQTNMLYRVWWLHSADAKS
jgi:hypothetical protein